MLLLDLHDFCPFSLFCSLASSVSLSYFNLTLPMRQCLGDHSSMSSAFSIAILKRTLCFRSAETAVSSGSERLLTKLNL